MYALTTDQSCAGCAGTERQKCKVRPSVRHLAPDFRDAGLAQQPRSSWFARLKIGTAALLAADARQRRNRRNASDLSRLDDRTLRDIGLTRFDIEQAITRARQNDL